MIDFNSLLTGLKHEHRYLLALTIKRGLWGDCDYEFRASNGYETLRAYGYITNGIVKGGGRRVSSMFNAIYKKLCFVNCGEHLSHANDWWGDGSGDVLFIRCDEEPEWTSWADEELNSMSEQEFLSIVFAKQNPIKHEPTLVIGKRPPRGGKREGAGRKKIDGHRRMWTIPTDIDNIAKEKGKEFLWDAIRQVCKKNQ